MPRRRSSPRTIHRPDPTERRRRSRLAGALAAALLALAVPAEAQQAVRRFPPPAARPAAAQALRLPAALAAAPDTTSSWTDLVRRVKVGRRVGVWLADLTTVKGDLLAIDERSITVREKAGPRVIPSAEVTRVRYLTHRSRNAFLATLVAVDALCALDQSRSEHGEPGECLEMGTIVLGLPAGGIASLIARGGDLYRAAPVSLAR